MTDTSAKTPSTATEHRSTIFATTADKVVLAVLLTASFTLAVDFSILNVALPVIGDDVGLSIDNLQWIATAFSLCAAGFTLLFGRIADISGRKKLFLLGMALLGVSSLAGALAQGPAVLLIARAAQGIATAMVTPAAISLLTTSFPEGPLRERALGLNGSLMAAGFTTGAVLGGLLTDFLNWRWAFVLNVVIAIAVLAVAPQVLRESKATGRIRLDVPGAVLVTGALLAIIYGLTNAGSKSWASTTAWAPIVVGLVALVVFWFVESSVPQPLVDTTMIRRGNIAWGNVAGMFAFASETSMVFLLTLYLQKVLGYNALLAGLSFAVLGIGTVLGGLVGPKVIGRTSPKNGIVLALTVQGAATVPLIFLTDSGFWIWVLLAVTFIGGVANLVAIVGFMVSATSGVPDEEQGLASGLATMSQQVGITMGIPIMSAIAATKINALPGGESIASNVLSGVTLAVFVNAVLCFVAAGLIAVFLRAPSHAGREHRRQARGRAERFSELRPREN